MSKTQLADDVHRIQGFSAPKTIAGVRNGYYQSIRAVEGYTGIGNSQPITFEVMNTLTDAIDLTRSYVATQFIAKAALRAAGATDISEDAAITLSQNAGARMFSRVAIWLNDVQIADEALQSDNHAHWVSWVDQITEKSGPYGQNAGLRFVTAAHALTAEEASGNRQYINGLTEVTTATADHAAVGAKFGAVNTAINGEHKFRNEVELSHSESDLRGVALARPSANVFGNLGENDWLCRLSPSAAARQRQITGGKVATLIFHPPAAIFRQTKMLPPGSRIRIELTKSTTDALFLGKRPAAPTAESYDSTEINYIQSRLMLRRVQFDESVQKAFKQFLDGPAPYNIPLWLARSARFATGTGSDTFQRTGVLSGPAAEVAYIYVTRDYSGTNSLISPYATGFGNIYYTGAVGTAATLGASAANPVFGDLALAAGGNAIPTIQEIYIKVGGTQFPQESLRLVNANGADLFQAYQSYLDASGVELVGGEKQPVLSYAQFKSNYTVFPISLRGDGSFNPTGSMARADANAANAGGLEVYIRFSAALTVSMDVFVLAYHTGYIALTNGGNNVNKVGM